MPHNVAEGESVNEDNRLGCRGAKFGDVYHGPVDFQFHVTSGMVGHGGKLRKIRTGYWVGRVCPDRFGLA